MPLNPEEEWSNTKYYTITAIVDRCLSDNELPDHYFDKFLGWALWNLRELRLDDTQDVKTVRLSMNNTRGVILPDDYVDWVIIGIQIGELVKTLGVNNNMVKLTGDERTLGNPSSFNALNVNSLPNGINVTNYGGYRLRGTGTFSVGGGIDYKGYFTILKESYPKMLQFSSLINKTDIYLEYISDGFNPNRETEVDPYLVNYLRCSTNHEWEQHRPRKERTDSAIRRTGIKTYYAQKGLRARVSDLDPQTMLNVNRRYYQLTPNV